MLSQTLSCFQNVDLYKKNSYNILKCWQRKSKNHTFTYLQFLKNAVQPDSTGEGTALSYIRGAAGTHTVWQSTNIVVSSIAYFKQTSFYQAVKLSLKKLLFFCQISRVVNLHCSLYRLVQKKSYTPLRSKMIVGLLIRGGQ